MRQYASDKVEISWQGLDLMQGVAQGSFITEARNAPTYSQKPTGVRSRVVRTRQPDRSGTLSIVLDQESETHKQLRALMQLDDVTRSVVGPMKVRDLSSGEDFTYTNAYIQTEPDEIRGTEAQTVTWVFNFESFIKLNGPQGANVVGS